MKLQLNSLIISSVVRIELMKWLPVDKNLINETSSWL